MFGFSAFSQSPFSTLGGGGVFEVSAEVISTSSITTNAIAIRAVSAAPASESSISSSALVIKSVQADIQSSSSIQASVATVIDCSANVSSISAVDCVANLRISASAFVSANGAFFPNYWIKLLLPKALGGRNVFKEAYGLTGKRVLGTMTKADEELYQKLLKVGYIHQHHHLLFFQYH